MMSIPEAAWLLAGFALAHGAWSVCDNSELLVPLAIVERNGQRQLERFEAGTQQEAIARGKAYMAALVDFDAWAFVRENSLNEKGNKVNVFSLDLRAKGTGARVTIIQRFEPYAKRKHFRLIGDPEIAIDGSIQDPSKIKEALETIRRGVSRHPKAAPLWDGWRRP